ncbi:hypothetical protein ACSMXN_00840 [Jatrophihabitans sp. DSM 45814]
MDPLLSRIEALAEDGCYSLYFLVEGGQERNVVMCLRDGEAGVPGANLLPGWSPGSESFRAAVSAVRALHHAREVSGPDRVRLMDVEGGWDVSLGNVVLSAAGTPSCVAHGEMESVEAHLFRCAECGAQAIY